MDKSRRCDGLDDCQDESDEVFCCKSAYRLYNARVQAMGHVGFKITLAPGPPAREVILQYFPQRDPPGAAGAAALCIHCSCATGRPTASTEGMSSTALRVGRAAAAARSPFDLLRNRKCPMFARSNLLRNKVPVPEWELHPEEERKVRRRCRLSGPQR